MNWGRVEPPTLGSSNPDYASWSLQVDKTTLDCFKIIYWLKYIHSSAEKSLGICRVCHRRRCEILFWFGSAIPKSPPF